MNYFFKKLFFTLCAGVVICGGKAFSMNDSIYVLVGNREREAAHLQEPLQPQPDAPQEKPDFFRKAGAFIAAPAATGFTFWGVWKGFETCCDLLKQRNYDLGLVRPYATIGVTALLAYNLASPLKSYLHTLFAGDQDELKQAINILNANEENIRDVLRELYYVKNKMLEDFKAKNQCSSSKEYETCEAAIAELQSDLFTKKIFALPDGDPFKFPKSLEKKDATKIALKDVLQSTKAIKPPKDSSNEHWWDLISAPIIKASNTVKKAGIYAWQSVQNYRWSFAEDKHLLATWGGAEVESAAKNLINAVDFLYGQGGIDSPAQAQEGFQSFAKAAAVIINYAEDVVSLLRKYRFEITRIDNCVDGTYRLLKVK